MQEKLEKKYIARHLGEKNKKKQHDIGREFFEDFSALTKIAINFHARGNELFTPHPAQAKARKLRARHVSNKVKYLLSRDDTNSDSLKVSKF